MNELLREDVARYPRPPALAPVPQRVRILLGGVVIVDTLAALRVLETHHAPTYYIPRAAVMADLAFAAGQSVCEWKGVARYLDVTAGGVTARRGAWVYATPTPAFAALAGHLAFYAGKMEACFVGMSPALPQPGDFYGGWVTPNLDGIPKGAPGTEYW